MTPGSAVRAMIVSLRPLARTLPILLLIVVAALAGIQPARADDSGPTMIQLGFAGQHGTLGNQLGDGVDLFLYSPAGSATIGQAPQFTYGLLDNVALLGHGNGGLDLKGQVVDSGGFASQTPVSRLALDQTLSYKNGGLDISTTLIDVGRNFIGSSGLDAALASGDQSSINADKAIGSQAGQNEQSISLALGNTRSGVVSVSIDRAGNSAANTNTGSTSLGYKFGDAHTLRFAFLDNSLIDHFAHTKTKTQSFTLGETIARLLDFTISHSVQQAGAGSAGIVDQVETALRGAHSSSIDVKGQMTHDSLGGYDKLFGVDAKRMEFGASIGFHLGEESSRPDGSSSGAESVSTLGYTIDKQYAKLVSFDSSWLSTDDRSKPAGQQQAVVASTKFLLTPLTNLSILNYFTSDDGTDNKTFDTSFTIPNSSTLAGTTLDANMTSSSSPSAASTHTRKLALDASLAKLKGLLQVASISDVHLEMEQTDMNAWGANPSTDYGAAAVKLAGSLEAFKDSHWSYAFVQRAPVAGAADGPTLEPVPDSRAFDLTLPCRRMTFKMYDHDQLPQPDGTYKDVKEQHFELDGPLPSGTTGGATFTETTDATGAFLTHSLTYGFDLTGRPGLFPEVELGVSRQVESEAGNGDDTGMNYKLAYTFLPPDSVQSVTLTCNLATNTFDDRTGAKDNTAATVHCDYAVKY